MKLRIVHPGRPSLIFLFFIFQFIAGNELPAQTTVIKRLELRSPGFASGGESVRHSDNGSTNKASEPHNTASSSAQFVDITASAGVAGSIADHGGHAIIFADINGDEKVDMYVTHTNFDPNNLGQFLVLPDELFINNGSNTFTENAATAGVIDPGQSHGAVFVDIDNDGDFDLFNGQRGPSGNRLYSNNGNGTFTEVTAAAGILPADRGTIGVLAVDIDNDGDMDLLSSNWGVGSEMYVNDGTGHFTVENRGVTDAAPNPNGKMAATAADVDNDGDMDIFVGKSTDVASDASKLYINNGSGYFTDQTAARGVAYPGHSHGAVFVDLDWDGDLDMLLSVTGPDRSDPIIQLGVYRNQGNGTFVDETNLHNIPYDGFTLNAGDLDNDGDIDIFTYINSGTGQVWRNDGTGHFTPQTNAGFSHVANDARAAALADIDNDGDLDVAFTEIKHPTSLYRNDLINGTAAQNYLQINLTGANGRAGLFGSKFYLFEAGHLDDPAYLRGYQQLTSTLGTLSQNSPIVHFGVSPTKTYDLRVRLLDGNSLVRTNITPGQRLNLQTAPDTQPPVISSVTASALTASAVTITWITNEAADSQVEYGLTTSYGSASQLASSRVTGHSVVLAALPVTTTHHYRVKSRDASGNLAVSGDFTFTTSTLPPPFDVTLEAENMPIKTVGRAEPPGWKLGENGYISQNVSFPAAGLYQFTLRARGNFAGGDWAQAELRLDQVAQTVITVNNSAYADFVVEMTVGAGTHQVAIAFINDYYDPPEDGSLWVDWLRIQTIGPTDTQPPLVSNVAASNITNSATTITWTTDEASDSQVEYGLTTSYGSSSPLNSALVTSHTVALSSLQQNTTYHYRVKSRDAAGNLAASNDFTFTTNASVSGNVAFANVQDVFNNNCVRCHQGTTAPGALVLLPGQAHGNIVNVTSTEYPQWQRVQPGNRASSWLYEKITNATPPVGSKMGGLSADEIELIGKWIDQGATTTPVPPYVELQFRTPTVVNGEIYITYGASFTVWGGSPPYQFSVIDGALPPGLELDPTAGMIAGVPNAVGSYDFTIRVSDSRSPATTRDQAYRIEVFNTRDHWRLPPGFEIETVVGDLHLPVNIAFVPNPGPNPTDPYFYVTLLYGDIVMVQRNFQKQTYATGLLNFTPTGMFPGSGEIGVTGIVVDPVSRDVFASMVYEEGAAGSEDFSNKVVRFHSTDGGRTAATQTTIIDDIAAGISHMIQEVTIGPDGKLYVNIGDGWVPQSAPDLNDRRGKVLRLNLDGSTPEDNPFPNNQTYASGFRNPFGAAWRQADGTLYVSDNGTHIDDRIARVLPGNDYGWELSLPDLTRGAVFLWNPTVAPVAIDFLQNNAFPANYFGNLFVGLSWPPYQTGISERGKKIQRLVFNAGGQVVSDSLFLDYVGAGAATVIGVAFGADGLYFTDLYGENGFDQFGQTHGNVYRIRWNAGDVTPPVIANVQTLSVTGTSATIVWQTDEPATRQVEYGLTTNYGLSTPVASNLLTNHSVTLSQLTPATTYHFHVISLDAATNPAISADFTFTTTAIDVTPPVISNVQIDSVAVTSALVKWTTNEPASSFVDFGVTTGYGVTASNPQLATTHRVQLTGLADSTLYHFRVRSLDASGNAAASSDGTFTTRHNHNTQIGTRLEAENMPIKTVGRAEPPGWKLGENGYIAQNVSFPVTGLYQLTLRAYSNFAGGDWAHAELRLDQVAQTVITVNSSTYADFVAEMTVGAGTHEVAIAFINDYWDPPEDGSLWVDWLRIQSTGPPDTQPPVISNVAASNVSASAATLSWSTDEASDSQVEYGLTTSYGSSSPLNSALVTSHMVTLSSLQQNTTYHYRVKSRDAAGNLAVSSDFNFTTTASSASIEFREVTTAAGIAPVDPAGYGHGASFGDYNGDGRPDIFALIYGTANFLYRNNGNGTFTDIAAAAGVQGADAHDRGTATADYDNDGDEDIYIACGYTGNFLFRNNGDGTFTDVAGTAGINDFNQGQGVAWGDYDNDGLLDLFLCNSSGPNRLFHQNPNHTFAEASASAGIGEESSSAQPIFLDVENDGDLDIFVSRGANIPKLLYINDGNGHFSERAAAWGLADPEADGGGVTIADYDRDGDLDIYLANSNALPNRLYANRGGYFEEVAANAGVANGDGAGIFADFDDDGWPDLYIFNFGPNKLYHNNGDGTFSAVSSANGADDGASSHGFSTADYDGDGDLDIFFTNSGSDNTLLRNERSAQDASGQPINWLHVRLQGESSNRNGVGARLVAWTGGARQTQFILAGAGYVSGAYDLTAHFGLGRSQRVDSLIVYWPSGTRDRFYEVTANQSLRVREGSGGVTDTTPPVISNVLASNVTSAGATIAWHTNETADSQVEYGLTTSYGSSSPLNSAQVTSHTVALSSLPANTTFHYRVKSRDAAGNLATSGDFTFTTTADVAPVIANVTANNITASAATIAWSTDEASDSQVEYGLTTSYGSSSPLNSAQVTSHTVALSSLQPNTTFHYRVKSRDAAGNLATSGDFTLTTLSSTPALDVTLEAENMPIKTVGRAELPGWKLGENGYIAQNVSFPATGLCQFTLRARGNFAGGDWAQAELRLDQVAQTTITINSSTYANFVVEMTVGAGTHEVAIAFINDYYDPPDDGSLWVDWLRIQSTGPADTQPPVIANVAASNITTSAATISWSTDEASDSQVEYGLTTSYGSSSPLNSAQVTSHTVALSSLQQNTTYHYRVKSRDAAGNLATSGDFTFTTLQGEVIPPVIANVAASNITTSAATISWSTDEASDSQVEYGLTTSYGSSSPLNSAQVTSHTVALSSLPANTTFHYRVKSRDAAGNLATSGDFTFTTTADVAPVIANVTANNITASAATIAWSTDEASDSQVEYGLTTSYGSSSSLNSAQVTSHTVALSSLQPNTTFHYRVKSRDAAGNLATSGNFTLTTLSSTPALDVTLEAENMPIKTVGRVELPGWKLGENGYIAQNVSFPAAGLYQFTLRARGNFAGGDWAHAELRLEQVAQTVITVNRSTYGDFVVEMTVGAGTHQVAVAFINDYYDPPEDGSLWVDWLRIQSTGPTDTQPPVIANVAASNITTSAATLSWSTDEVSDSQVEYGLTTSYGSSSPLNSALVTSHAVALSSLQANTTYHYRVKSKDAAGNLATSGDFTFTTLPGDVTPPVISNVAASNITASAATIAWSTDEASDSQVEYGLTTSYGSSSPLNSALLISHTVALSSLQPNTTFHYRVKSRDAAGNLATSNDFTFTTTADVAPPVIANVAANNITASAATLSWSTNEASDSQVEYGLTTSYGSSSPLNSAQVTSHTVALSSLPANTTFHYRVKSRDAAGNLATSGDFTFTTTADVAPVIANVTANNITASAATIAWSTDEASDSQVEYGLTTSYGSSSPLNSAQVTSHTVALSSLQPNTTFHYRVKSRDAAGNLATSGDFTLTTLSSTPALDVTLEAENMPIKTVGRAELPGWKLGENGYIAQNVSFPATGLCQFTLRARGNFAGGDWAQAELRLDQVAQTTITINSSTYANFVVEMTVGAGTHEVAIAFINDYYDPPDDGSLWVDWLRIQSTGPADTQPPVIANVAASNITTSAATISWSTDEASDSQVEYGLTTSYGSSSPLNSAQVTSHTVALSSLQQNTTYHYRVKSRDAAGNLATSGDFTFTTLQGEVIPPVIANVAASNITTSAATISWSTDEASDSQVEYGLTTSYGSSSPLNSAQVTSHTVALSSLPANTTFHYRVKSRDAAGNLATSGDFAFTTTADVTPPVISNVAASNITASAATIAWSTNEASDSQVEYGVTASYGSSSPLNSALVISHTAALSSLQANTTFHYRVKSRDAAGNLATSGDFTLTTLTSTPVFDVTLEAENMPIKTVGRVELPGWKLGENGYIAQNVSFPAAGLYQFTLRARGNFAGGDWAQAELRLDQVAQTVITVNRSTYGDFVVEMTVGAGTHQVAVAFINDYYDPPEDGSLWVDWLRIQSTGPTDTQPPVIANVAASNITTSAATLSWSTDEASDSQVEYGLTTSYGSSSPLNSAKVTSHTVALSSLQQNTTFHYRVKSRDAAGNLATSSDLTFTTLPGEVIPPVIANVAASNITTSTATISWATDEASDSQVEYGLTTSYGSSSPLNSAQVTSHTVALSSLQQNTTFHYRVKSRDAAGNLATSGDFTFTTLTGEVIPPVISNVAASNITTSAATISWATDEASDSQVEYGLTTSYGSSSPLNSALVISHTVALSSLQPNTTFHYRVKSRDAAGNLATSGDFTFITTAPTADNVAFANVQDIFNNNCVRCHQGATAPGGLVLLPGQAHGNIVNITSTEYPQWQRVQPGNRASSWLYEKITNATPPAGSKMGSLSAAEIELISKWIDQGATTTPVPPYVDLQFRTPTVVNGEIYIAYGASFTVWGGLPPYQFSVVDGALPPGLALDPTAGMLGGVPNTVGSYDFTIRVSDSQSPVAMIDQAYHLEVFNTRDHWQVPPGFEIETVVGDLHLPVNIAFVPNPGPNPTDPYFYVTLLYGDIVMVQRNFQKQTYATGLLNFTPTGEFPGSGEIGVIGIAVDPVSGDVFASMVYEETPGGENFRNKVVRFHSTDGGHTAATQTSLLDNIPAAISHMIQAVTIGPDGKLYVNVSDGWTPDAAPDLNDRRGKVLRVNLDGSTPEDNPFPDSQVYASGFRNPFGAAWRQADGTLYISDNGPEFDDRVARVVPGGNYGWEANLPDLTKGAVFRWNPTVAPVAMDFLQNNAFPAHYFGNLFVGLSWPPYQTGISERGKKIQRLVFNAGDQVVSDSLFLDYVGAGAATVIGVAFGADGLYFTDLYGENGFDQFGQTHGNVYRIRWGTTDVTPPVIANVEATFVTGTSATIVWQTDEPTTRQVEYGLTTNYGSSTPVASNLLTNHSVTLSQLTPATTYHFHVISLDAAANPAISVDFTFTTTAIDVTPPVISNVQIDSVAATSALVKWTTNEPASSFVDFGATTDYGATASKTQLVTAHRVQLTGLADSTLYHFRVRSLDASGNAAASSDGTFTTRHHPQIDTRLEAENMPIKTVGRAEPPGWKLGDEGYIAENVSFPATGLYQFTLQAYSNFAGGDWAQAELRLDQVAQTVITINSSAYADFVVGMTVDAGTHEVAIAFINNYFDPPDDRDLWVDWLRIQTSSAGGNVIKSKTAASAVTSPPATVALQNYPNPFNDATRIRFALPQAAEIEIKIFDMAGHELLELANGERAAGSHEVIWNGRGRNGNELSSGVYLVRLRYRSDKNGAWSQLRQRVLLVK